MELRQMRNQEYLRSTERRRQETGRRMGRRTRKKTGKERRRPNHFGLRKGRSVVGNVNDSISVGDHDTD
jgi:hypothetical protein